MAPNIYLKNKKKKNFKIKGIKTKHQIEKKKNKRY